MKLPLKTVRFRNEVSYFRAGGAFAGAKLIWNDKLMDVTNTAKLDEESRTVHIYDLRTTKVYDEIRIPLENVVQYQVDYSKVDQKKKK